MQKSELSTAVITGRLHLLSISFAFLAVLSTGGSSTLFVMPIIGITTVAPLPLPEPQHSPQPLSPLSLPSPPSSSPSPPSSRPPFPPLPPPLLPPSPMVVKVSGGYYPEDVPWSLACDGLADNTTGGAPHEDMHAVPPGTCTFEMVHGWTGTRWSAPGWTDGTFTVSSSASYPPVVEIHHALTDELYKTDKPLADELSNDLPSPFRFLFMNVHVHSSSAPSRAQQRGQLWAAWFFLLLGVCGVLRMSELMWPPRFGAASVRRSNSGRLVRCRTEARHSVWLFLVALLPLACALSPSPPSLPPSPPQPLPPPLMFTGGCALRSSALDNVEYVAVGYTYSGAPYFRDTSSSYYIYWDPTCNDTGSTARWIVDDDVPSTTASSDLDGDGKCSYWAHIDSDDSSSPPLGTATWRVYCDGSWTDNDLTLAFLSPPPPAPPAPPPWPPGRAPLPPPPELPPPLPPADCDAAEATWRTHVGAATGPAYIFGALALLVPTASQPKLFLALYLPTLALGIPAILVASPLGFSWLVPEHCDYDLYFLVVVITLPLLFIFPPLVHLVLRKRLRALIAAIEGDLPQRLADGSLRLLRVAWLLERPTDWVLPRQQDLPEEAFWAPADAARLLAEEKVAALSYKWQGPFNSSKGGGDQPDGSRFHLEQVLSYYREGRHAEERPALMWDFAAIPQHDPITGAKRTAAETDLFKKGLGVMSNAYASPRVLVLQHRRIPLHLERELNEIYDGAPPADRLDLIPYAGAKCRSGWCTFETACALLMTEGGGHAYELGVGCVPVTRGRLPSVQHMEALFEAESTRFIGRADRERVCGMYLDLREKLEEYDEELVSVGDDLMTEEDAFRRILTLVFPFMALVFFPFSRILRAHLAAVLCCRPRDSLDYTFHWSLCKPPFRRKPDTPLSELPSCFLPTQQGEQAPSGLISMSSMFAKVRLSQERVSKLEREEGVSEDEIGDRARPLSERARSEREMSSVSLRLSVSSV
ncbi:hypothetical protein EMIHUDRAFT_113645 [Emiliania huxleyi CCMP1516]|uniref:Uncharacterized protein n=2 Tax=Emiliania huxleyi TaxID=2903 RepID=A0A0D3K1H1_EMIH1|nr:hypothetical protein EMIHUDRAFT_113645 [Emiliania huxleyi CCMP1516]EOD29606.1 hypothetical protein EMIHUDRAFT_113645 [Emiliania huxleyi CCMP1516]|eukprot:XP_005782035.1 hypothetical protein EMIHUDRAFT_113645 [Emiliania huxleyi CCMP1516]